MSKGTDGYWRASLKLPAGTFRFRYQNRSQGIERQLKIVLLPPLRRLGTLQLDGVDCGEIVWGARANQHCRLMNAD